MRRSVRRILAGLAIVAGAALVSLGCGGDEGGSSDSGTQYCNAGECYSGGYCCPPDTPYYCQKDCYLDCLSYPCTTCKTTCY